MATATEARLSLDEIIREALDDARLAFERGDLDEAEQLCSEVLAAEPNGAAAMVLLGQCRAKAGDHASAIEIQRHVLTLDEGSSLARMCLGTSLGELGHHLEAEAVLRSLLTREPESDVAHANLATCLAHAGKWNAALHYAERAASLAPACAIYLVMSAKCSFHLEDPKAGLLRLEGALRCAPDDSSICFEYGRGLLALGRGEQALAFVEERLKRLGATTPLCALKCLALRALDKRDELATWLCAEELIFQCRIAAPSAWEDLEAFNRALAHHVKTHPTLVRAPRSQATVDAFHSGSLLSQPKGPVEAFEAEIAHAIADYWARLETHSHPFAHVRPKSLIVNPWGVVMGAKGHQRSHIHPSAWVSACYYPEVPNDVATSSSNRGALVFEVPRLGADTEFTLDAAVELATYVRPKAGLLVMFPSFFFHHTLPSESTNERVSLAIDLVEV